jgi:PKD repeat protein
VINGPYSGQAGSPISFSSAGSNDPGGSITAYLWSFGDNTTSTQANPTKTYTAAGSYSVTLTVTDNGGLTRTATTTATVTAAPGGGNQAPLARANGPYTATVGQAITLSSAGSTDPDGSIVLYQWSLGDGRNVSGASPSVSYTTAGTYNVTLTATDNAGATGTSNTTVVVSPAVATQPLIWRSSFGPVDVATGTASITISYDLRTNIPETPSSEALASFTLDSLKWNASLLQFQSISLGPNIVGTSNQAGVNEGRLAFRGTISGAQQQGLITIATLRFRIVGTAGARVTTITSLGPLIGAASTGTFLYNAKTAVVEADLVLP